MKANLRLLESLTLESRERLGVWGFDEGVHVADELHDIPDYQDQGRAGRFFSILLFTLVLPHFTINESSNFFLEELPKKDSIL